VLAISFDLLQANSLCQGIPFDLLYNCVGKLVAAISVGSVSLSPVRLLNSTMSKVDSTDLWGWSLVLNFSCFCHLLLAHSIAEISSVYSLELNTSNLGASFCEFCLHVEDSSYITGDWLE